ncbi:MAG: threonine ammonia-lyase [Azospirillaceae bacterium]
MTSLPASAPESPDRAADALGLDTLPVDLAAIRAAREAIAGEVMVTPTIPAPVLSEWYGCDLHLKLETLHATGSFKERGALNRLKALTPEQRERGIIAMSAGNHAQGVAYHAKRLGIPATIVMPRLTPFTKVARTEACGATVVLQGESLDDARPAVERLVAEQGLTLIHPYDDPAIVAGQGTIGLEILEAVAGIDDIVVPIGGGGIISGIAIAARTLNPAIRITGVEVASFASMSDALAGRTGVAYTGATLAEGIAVKSPGGITLPIVRALVDDILIVDEARIEDAVHTLLRVQKLQVEGAGAAGLAAIAARPDRFAGRRVVTPACGGNIDARVLSSILMRGLARAGQLVRLRVEIDDAPGVLAKVSGVVGNTGGNIVEVYHQRLFYDLPVKRADIDVVVETRDRQHVARIVEELAMAGFEATILTDLGG